MHCFKTVFWCAAVAASLSLATRAQAELVSHWTLDETTGVGTTVYDDVGTNNGTLKDNTTAAIVAPTVGVAGQIGTAIAFNSPGVNTTGDIQGGYVALPFIVQPTSYTISAWIKLPNYSANAHILSWGSFQTTSTASSNFSVFYNSGVPVLNCSELSTTAAFKSVRGTTALYNAANPDKYYQVAVTSDASGNISLYVDGVLETSLLTNNNPLNGNVSTLNTATIGGVFSGTITNAQHRQSGALDDMALWGNVLSGTEVKSVYSLGVDTLNYSADMAQDLFSIYAGGQGSQGQVGGEIWAYVTGLTGTPGTVVNDHTALVLDASGNGVQIQIVPEPSTLALLAAGLLGLLAYAWRKRK